MVSGLHVVFLFVIQILLIDTATSTCVFPDDIRGLWYSSGKGLLNFTDTHLLQYPVEPSALVSSLDFECHEVVDTVYVLRSTESFTLFSAQFVAYLCLDLQPVSHYKYRYYIKNDNLNTINGPDRFKAVQMINPYPGFDGTCTRSSPYEVATFNTLVKDGAFEDGLTLQTCPTSLRHTFSSSTLSSGTGAATSESCTGSTVDVCANNTQMFFDYGSSCSASLKPSDTGNYVCLLDYTNQSTGVTYLHLWNNDTSLAATDTKIHCYAFESSGSVVSGTLYPGQCEESQTSGTVNSPGINTALSNITATCVTTAEGGSQTAYIAAIIAGCIVFILLIVLCIVIIKCRRRVCKCCYERSRRTKIDHSESSIGSDMLTETSSGGQILTPAVFVPKKARKLGPVSKPLFVQPAKVELLYEVIPRPMSSKKKFMPKSIYTSRISLRCS